MFCCFALVFWFRSFVRLCIPVLPRGRSLHIEREALTMRPLCAS